MIKGMIREWLTKNGHSRQWLADQCGVTLKTVNNWLSSDRAVPAKAIKIIERLMNSPRRQHPQLVIELTTEEFEKINLAALEKNMTMTAWAKRELLKFSVPKIDRFE